MSAARWDQLILCTIFLELLIIEKTLQSSKRPILRSPQRVIQNRPRNSFAVAIMQIKIITRNASQSQVYQLVNCPENFMLLIIAELIQLSNCTPMTPGSQWANSLMNKCIDNYVHNSETTTPSTESIVRTREKKKHFPKFQLYRIVNSLP